MEQIESGELKAVREIVYGISARRFYMDLMGDWHPVRVEALPWKNTPGQTLVLTRSGRTLGTFNVAGERGACYIAHLRGAAQTEIICALYEGNGVFLSDFQIIGLRKDGRVGTLLSLADLPSGIQHPTWSLAGRTLAVNYMVPDPSCDRPYPECPFFEYRVEISWNPVENRFAVTGPVQVGVH